MASAPRFLASTPQWRGYLVPDREDEEPLLTENAQQAARLKHLRHLAALRQARATLEDDPATGARAVDPAFAMRCLVLLLPVLFACSGVRAQPETLPTHLLGRWASVSPAVSVLVRKTVIVLTSDPLPYSIAFASFPSAKAGPADSIPIVMRQHDHESVCVVQKQAGDLVTAGDDCILPDTISRKSLGPQAPWWEVTEGAVESLMERPEFVAEVLAAASGLGLGSPTLLDWHTRRIMESLEVSWLLGNPNPARRLVVRIDQKGALQAGWAAPDDIKLVGSLFELKDRDVTAAQAEDLGRRLWPWIQAERLRWSKGNTPVSTPGPTAPGP